MHLTPNMYKNITLKANAKEIVTLKCVWISLAFAFKVTILTPLNREEITLCSDSVWGGPYVFGVCIFIYALVFPYIFLLNSEEINLCYDSVGGGGSICLWVSMTPLNSEEITLCYDSVDQGGPSALGVCIFIYALVFPYIFLLNSEDITLYYDNVVGGVHLPLVSVSLYMHWYFLKFSYWTVKTSLCAMTMLLGGSICLWCLYLYICTGISLNFLIEQWRHHSVLWQCCWGGPSALSVCIFIYALVFPYIFLLNSEDITLCYNNVVLGGSICLECLYLYICTGISLYFLIEQWRHHSVLWQCCWGGPSALGVCIFIYALKFPYNFLLNSEEINLCYDSVGGGSICLWVSMTPLNSEEITLCYDSVDWGGASALGVCIFIYALKFPYIFLLNSEDITLCYDNVVLGGSICLWCLYLYICTGISLNFLIEQWRDQSVLWQCWWGGPSAFESQWHH